jgi:putative acetyltransferase
MDLKIVRTTSANIDFKALVAELDAHLAELYGAEQPFYSKHNNIDAINNVIVAYDNNGFAIGCGGIKAYTNTIMEIKRMFVKPDYRGKGIASTILTALENWAMELGYASTVLETLKIKASVISMYAKNGYYVIPNYGQYQQTESSVCMQKKLNLAVAK